MKRLLKIGLILLMSFSGFAQKPPKPDIQMDQLIQQIAAVQNEDNNYEDLYESLMQFYLSPLDINSVSADELKSLNILSDSQIDELLSHREKYGALLSLYELQSIPSFDLQTIASLLPFVQIYPRTSLPNLLKMPQEATNHFLIIRTERTLEQAKGFEEGKYLGNPYKTYLRYRMQHSKAFSAGFILEKDQGEDNWTDYSTFHLQIQDRGKLKNLMLGDFQMQCGQGLILAGGYSAGKGSESIYTTRRSDLGFRPYNSVIEGGFFRGIGATFGLNKIDLSAFVSANTRDASANTQYENNEAFSSILISGLHRTQSEKDKKGVLQEQNIGVHMKWNFQKGQLGLTSLFTHFGTKIERNPRPYTRYEFTGNSNAVIGPNFSYTWQNFNFFGEAAYSSSGGIGALGGFVAALSPKWEWALNFRHYDKNFHSFYANSFRESSRTINENGIYTGLKFTPKKGIVWSAFYDKFKFPWLRYLVDAPSQGYDYLLRFSFRTSKKWNFYLQYHREQKEKNKPNNDTPLNFTVHTWRQNLLGQFEFKLNETLKSQTRLQFNTFKYEGLKQSNGLAFIQDIEGRIRKFQWKGRIAYFRTNDYDSRIYAYENDVLYSISFPAYYGHGIRLYLVHKIPIGRKLDFWLKIARTQLFDADKISSGLNEIDQPHKTDLKLQLRYRIK
ncbi:helix-hairpin-helix domain-containing protein [Marinilongibacter aquaticus]|uniref:ComEA family DNA-binding protein n=1 Tax=Marinilongibacter aquaticus TaxID=2975157 RepID=UPI0021BDCE1F|nr:helix-hairpin-helix domain-containing protein [Marinilongibacter aquaticus]UBM60668.1 helix-hairpin-helix domain-containing protein [Marinilongibacter aquaticus]